MTPRQLARMHPRSQLHRTLEDLHPTALAAQPLLRRDPALFEDHLRHRRCAKPHLFKGTSDCQARRRPLDDESRDPHRAQGPIDGRVGDKEVGHPCVGHPRFVAAEDVVASFSPREGAHREDVGPCIRLRCGVRPDERAIAESWQVTLFLRFRAIDEDGNGVRPEVCVERERAGPDRARLARAPPSPRGGRSARRQDHRIPQESASPALRTRRMRATLSGRTPRPDRAPPSGRRAQTWRTRWRNREVAGGPQKTQGAAPISSTA